MIGQMTETDPILARFRSALNDLYGDRIERVVLYGSRARGDAKPDSDYDVALFLRELTNRWQEVRKLVDIERAITGDTGIDIHTMPFPAGAWRDTSSPVMNEIRNDGVDL